MWSAMAVTARRTVAKVKSSAMRPRQPEVPNLMGEAAVFAEALMGGYSTRAGGTLKEGAGGAGGDQDYGGATAGIGEGSEANAQLRCTGIHRASNCGGVARIFEMD